MMRGGVDADEFISGVSAVSVVSAAWLFNERRT
jgi:hypothetical protein